MGKFLALLLLACAAGGGALMYYQQVYAYYDEVEPNGETDVQITSMITDAPELVLYDDFRAIDATSSPIRYRACFNTSMSHAMLTETYVLDDGAVPLTAPGWFDCFDAREIGAAIEVGEALAFTGTENIEYGIDRVVAIHEDGRGWVWDQLNRCGEIVFDGNRAPDDCPEPPEGY
ncbi:hypothetical protein SAMN05421666_0510 [Roseovarius nanhaiticus]|uniref:Histidine kinase n=1 Tax=Roseovarius nanhaiticus TaxID=573024 RepID=A0A1N7ETF8_9RHOB|nr:DUF6446 family protein [Roseovarius nanhaiticus]SEK67103.1 hypothetical protein SAMN05216208_1625 [Roseovarius nanhaiticus]SIR91304.1 hypothetical protein SAMN05421666_0510 [Roseovarius nanhaiticus]